MTSYAIYYTTVLRFNSFSFSKEFYSYIQLFFVSYDIHNGLMCFGKYLYRYLKHTQLKYYTFLPQAYFINK